MDEARFQQHGSRCDLWVPPEEEDPIVYHAPPRKSVALFGAVNVRTGQLVSMLIPQFDAETFEAFLGLLLRHRRRSRRMVAILDNATYRCAEKSRPFFHRHRQHLRLDNLPPYSPELDPIERVWKLLRKCAIHHQYFAELDDLIKVVSKQLCLWAKPNPILEIPCRLIPAA